VIVEPTGEFHVLPVVGGRQRSGHEMSERAELPFAGKLSGDEHSGSTDNHASTYLREIGAMDLLTRNDEQRLARALEAGAYVGALRERICSINNVLPTGRQVLIACYDQLLEYQQVMVAA
jgi:hypothetical protein